MIRVIGDEIEFDRTVVATLKAGVTPSITAAFVSAVDEAWRLRKRVSELEEQLEDERERSMAHEWEE